MKRTFKEPTKVDHEWKMCPPHFLKTLFKIQFAYYSHSDTSSQLFPPVAKLNRPFVVLLVLTKPWSSINYLLDFRGTVMFCRAVLWSSSFVKPRSLLQICTTLSYFSCLTIGFPKLMQSSARFCTAPSVTCGCQLSHQEACRPLFYDSDVIWFFFIHLGNTEKKARL